VVSPRFIRFVNDGLEKTWENVGLFILGLLQEVHKTRRVLGKADNQLRFESSILKTQVHSIADTFTCTVI
jgi:hypothetical protein